MNFLAVLKGVCGVAGHENSLGNRKPLLEEVQKGAEFAVADEFGLGCV